MLVGEDGAEMGEIDLGLTAWRRLEPHLKGGGPRGPDLAQDLFDRGVAAGVAHLADLPQQPRAGEVGISGDALLQIRLEAGDHSGARLTRLVDGRLEPALNVFAHGLAVGADTARDGRDAEALPMQIQDQDDLPKPDHPLLPELPGRW